MIIQSETLWIELVIGSRRLSNIFWASLLFLGALGFLIVGLSSYFGKELIPFLSSKPILFTPQGLVMCFYGIGGIFLSLYLWCAILLKVGSGYNEFDRQEGIISVFRWGFPGENRRIRIRCLVEDVQAIQFKVNEVLGSRPVISLKLKGQQDITLTPIEESLTLTQMEEKAAQLARFLRVPIEGL
uniref:Photosystem I assembly protein Ycf4 n=1 Tax=Netrium digitus TaxID=43946 RepID=A0A191T576_9VIRI|nr:hypothetical chloroplast RF4 [Netrium digitus]ANI25545.1 hypothetical chloroplast RF4 [Netrium digitus]